MSTLEIAAPVSPSGHSHKSKLVSHDEFTREMISRGYLSSIKLPKISVSLKSPKPIINPCSESPLSGKTFTSSWFAPVKNSIASTQLTIFSVFSPPNSSITLTSRKFPTPAETKLPSSPRRSPRRSRPFSLSLPTTSTRNTRKSVASSKAEKRQALIAGIVECLGSREATVAAIETSCPSLREGVVSISEFLKFLKVREIRWEELTGYRSASSLFRLISAESGNVDLYLLLDLGRPINVQRIPTEGLIDRYMRGIQRPFSSHETPLWIPKDLEARIERSDEFAQCLNEAELKRRWIKFMFRQGASKLEILAPHLHGITGSENDEAEIEKVIRGDIDTIRQHVRSIEAGIRDFATFRKEVERCRGELNGVSIEQQRREEEERRRRQLKEQRKQMARDLNNNDSLIGQKMHDASTMFRMPTEAELVNYFKEEECVDVEERKFRKLIKSLGISILDGEDIRKKFESLDLNKNGRLEKDEFSELIAEMLGFVSSKVPVPQSEVDKYWRGIPKDNLGEETINFENFLIWFRGAQAQRII
jgi:Ca2+-binding EF-hand superfamily protein